MVMERHVNRAKSAEMGCLCSQHGVPFLRYDSDFGGGHVWADRIGEIIMTTPKELLGSLTFRVCDANGSDLGLGWED